MHLTVTADAETRTPPDLGLAMVRIPYTSPLESGISSPSSPTYTVTLVKNSRFVLIPAPSPSHGYPGAYSGVSRRDALPQLAQVFLSRVSHLLPPLTRLSLISFTLRSCADLLHDLLLIPLGEGPCARISSLLAVPQSCEKAWMLSCAESGSAYAMVG